MAEAAAQSPSSSLPKRDLAEAAPAQRAADQAGGGSGSVVLPPDGGFAPGQRNRKIERSVGLELEMPVDQMARVAEQVTAVTNRHGGLRAELVRLHRRGLRRR